MIRMIMKIMREKRYKKQKFAGKSSSSNDQFVFESSDHERQPSFARKTREHPRWFDRPPAEYIDYLWVRRSSAEDRFNEVVDTYQDADKPEDEEIEPDNSTLTFAKRLKRQHKTPYSKLVIQNKLDEENTVIRNKTSLVVRGYRQEEGIDFGESFAPVARIEAIVILLAYATHKSFIMYQIDVKTAFMHGSANREAPQGGKKDLSLSSGNRQYKSLSNYVLKILKKYGMKTCDPIGTPMETKNKLDLAKNGTLVDATKYQSMIDALMYLTSNRSNTVHATCLCARYQALPTEKHLKEAKSITIASILATGAKDSPKSIPSS
nr:hypothetical protein [Tanacetum cinerariifolium]